MSKRANKLLCGFENIYRANINENGEFDTPFRIWNGREIESELEYETTSEYADNTTVSTDAYFKGGKGKVNFLGLTPEEYCYLFDSKRARGGYSIGENDAPKAGAWLFEQRKKGSNHRKLTVIYCSTCVPSKTAAETIKEGKAESKEVEIDFIVGSYEYINEKRESIRLIEFSIETDDPTVDKEQIENWYKEVQFPRDFPEPPTITAEDKTLTLNGDWKPLENITAQDGDGIDITKNIVVTKDNVKPDTADTYEVEYSVTDRFSQTTTKTINVTVS